MSRAAHPSKVFATYVASPHYENQKIGLKTAEGRCEEGMCSEMRTLKAGDCFSIRQGLYGLSVTAILLRIVSVQRFENLLRMYESQTAGVVYIPSCSNFTAFEQVYQAYGDPKKPWIGYEIERFESAASLETKPLQRTLVWVFLPREVKERVFGLLAYKPDLCRLAAVCGGFCCSLRNYITRTIIATNDLPLGTPLLYNRNEGIVHIVCPVLRDDGVDPFIVWYELLSNIRGSLLRVLIITSPAMGWILSKF